MEEFFINFGDFFTKTEKNLRFFKNRIRDF